MPSIEEQELSRLVADYLWCPNWPWKKTTVVRVGTWPRGQVAGKTELAVAFYRDGKLLRRYSTLDIAGKPEAVHASISHHRVFGDIDSFRAQFTAQSRSQAFGSLRNRLAPICKRILCKQVQSYVLYTVR